MESKMSKKECFEDLMEVIEDNFNTELEEYMTDRAADIIENVDEDELVGELERRRYKVYLDDADVEDMEQIPVHWTKEQLREHLLTVLHMGHYHTDRQIAERVMEELMA